MTTKKAILLTDLFTDDMLIHCKAGKEVEVIKQYDNGFTIIKYDWFKALDKTLSHTCKIYSKRLKIA